MNSPATWMFWRIRVERKLSKNSTLNKRQRVVPGSRALAVGLVEFFAHVASDIEAVSSMGA